MRPALAATALLAVTLTACGGESEPTAGDTAPPAAASETAEQSATASPSEQATAGGDDSGSGAEDTTVIEIEIEGQTIQPNGRRVQVPAGEPVTLQIKSDRAAELHVHSSPEQTIEFQAGESTRQLTIDRPGVVDVEEHGSGLVVVQLEVR